jgi:hypothetical protein
MTVCEGQDDPEASGGVFIVTAQCLTLHGLTFNILRIYVISYGTFVSIKSIVQ